MKTTYFDDKISSQLYPYQIRNFIKTNQEDSQFAIIKYPKCGVNHPHLVKGGSTDNGKQMMRYTHCNKWFIVNHG